MDLRRISMNVFNRQSTSSSIRSVANTESNTYYFQNDEKEFLIQEVKSLQSFLKDIVYEVESEIAKLRGAPMSRNVSVDVNSSPLRNMTPFSSNALSSAWDDNKQRASSNDEGDEDRGATNNLNSICNPVLSPDSSTGRKSEHSPAVIENNTLNTNEDTDISYNEPTVSSTIAPPPPLQSPLMTARTPSEPVRKWSFSASLTDVISSATSALSSPPPPARQSFSATPNNPITAPVTSTAPPPPPPPPPPPVAPISTPNIVSPPSKVDRNSFASTASADQAEIISAPARPAPPNTVAKELPPTRVVSARVQSNGVDTTSVNNENISTGWPVDCDLPTQPTIYRVQLLPPQSLASSVTTLSTTPLHTHPVASKLVSSPSVNSIIQFNTKEEASLIDSLNNGVRNKDPMAIMKVLKDVDLTQVYVIERACFAIASVASVSKDCRTQFGQLDACNILVTCLGNLGPSYPSLIEMLSNAIINICYQEPSNVQKFVEAKFCEMLSSAIRTLGLSYPVLAGQMFRLISIFSAEDKNAIEKFGQAGVCEYIIGVLFNHGTDDETLVERGLAALFNLTVSAENKKRIGTFPAACEVIINCTKLYSTTNVTISMCASRLITSVCANISEHTTNFGNAGACELASHLFELNPFSRTWADMSLKSILSLGMNHVQNKQRFTQTSVFSVVVNFLKSIVSDSAILVSDINASMRTQYAAQGHTVSGEGVQGNPSLVELSLRVITALAVGNSENTRALGTENIADVLAVVLFKFGCGPISQGQFAGISYEFHLSVVETAIAVVLNLSASDMENRKYMINAGLGESLLYLVRYAGTDKSALLERGFKSLMTLCTNNNDFKTKMGSISHACENILLVMSGIDASLSTNIVAIESSFRVIISLMVSHAENTRISIEYGACKISVAAMDSLGVTNPVAFDQGCRLLQVLSVNNTDIKLKLCDSGAPQVLAKYLRTVDLNTVSGSSTTATATASAIEQTCVTILNLASAAETIQKLGSSGAGEGVVRVLDALSLSHPQITDKGLRALINLSSANLTNKASLMEAGIQNVLVNILKGPGLTNVSIAECSYRVLYNLTANSSTNQNIFGESEMCSLPTQTLSSLCKDATNSTLIEQICRCIVNLAADNPQQNATQLGAGHGCQVLISLLESALKTNQMSIVERVCGAIQRMCSLGHPNRSLFANSGAVAVLNQVVNYAGCTAATKTSVTEILKLL